MLSQKNKVILQFCISFIIIFFAVLTFGSVVRNESSPWVWEELKNKLLVPTIIDKILLVSAYIAFYLMGFLIPYWVTTFILFIRRRSLSKSEYIKPISQREYNGRLFLSLSMLVIYLFLMKSILAFIKALPIDVWNGWLLIIGLAVSAFFAFAALNEFRAPNKDV
ncbi:MAG: hypothetical protein ACM3Q2_00315 [Syntrophothermus sp.]